MAAALSEEFRHLQMLYCIREKLPKLTPTEIDDSKVLNVVCYGPSLEDTWREVKKPFITVSGAHDFMIERGMIPDYHTDMDPRKHKLKHILKPHKDVTYLMASVCNPFAWSLLKGFNLKTWHVVSGKHTKNFIAVHDPGAMLVCGGSSVGLAAAHVGGVLGFRKFEIHGMDGCFKDGKRHSGKHYGHDQKEIDWMGWKTSKIMANANQEFLNMLNMFPFFAVVHGDGLLQDMVEKADLPNAARAGTEKAAAVLNGTVTSV